MPKLLLPTAPTEENHHHIHAPTHRHRVGISRRGVLTASAAIGGAALAGVFAPAWAQQSRLRPTSEQVMGPFYPMTLPADQDADLTVIAGKSGRALGQILYVSGRVTNVRGEPIANAELEIWQANSVGRYSHPGDQGPAVLDPNFEGYAKIRTGADGNYSFKTVKPAAYPTGINGWSRPPHIHFDIKGRTSRLVTQMYFAGELLNEKDKLFTSSSVDGRKSLLSRYEAPSGKQERDALVARWDVVLHLG